MAHGDHSSFSNDDGYGHYYICHAAGWNKKIKQSSYPPLKNLDS